MAQHHTLNATKRSIKGTGKLNALRAQGILPGVVYGAGVETIDIQINAREFAALLAGATSEHMLVDLQIDGAGKLCLLKDIQHNFLTDTVIHADFLSVNDNTVISSLVPVVLQGEAAGTKFGGLVDQTLHELPIKCKVKNLPEEISVDISALNIGDILRVAAITLPSGIETSLDGEVGIVTIEGTVGSDDAAEEAAAPEA